MRKVFLALLVGVSLGSCDRKQQNKTRNARGSGWGQSFPEMKNGDQDSGGIATSYIQTKLGPHGSGIRHESKGGHSSLDSFGTKVIIDHNTDYGRKTQGSDGEWIGRHGVGGSSGNSFGEVSAGGYTIGGQDAGSRGTGSHIAGSESYNGGSSDEHVESSRAGHPSGSINTGGYNFGGEAIGGHNFGGGSFGGGSPGRYASQKGSAGPAFYGLSAGGQFFESNGSGGSKSAGQSLGTGGGIGGQSLGIYDFSNGELSPSLFRHDFVRGGGQSLASLAAAPGSGQKQERFRNEGDNHNFGYSLQELSKLATTGSYRIGKLEEPRTTNDGNNQKIGYDLQDLNQLLNAGAYQSTKQKEQSITNSRGSHNFEYRLQDLSKFIAPEGYQQERTYPLGGNSGDHLFAPNSRHSLGGSQGHHNIDYSHFFARMPFLFQQPHYQETVKQIPVKQNLRVPVPHPVRQPFVVPFPVNVPDPYLLPIPYPVAVEKKVEVPVEKQITKNVEKPVPMKVEKQVAVAVPKPYPIPVPFYKTKYVYHHTEKVHGDEME